mmetsp:Transcript_5468/g.8700  ORF Transcript_5468/g.8700 Transcript_5468/m.8700 type:complete len:154 (+) Transcript_5468:123-584(+)
MIYASLCHELQHLELTQIGHVVHPTNLPAWAYQEPSFQAVEGCDESEYCPFSYVVLSSSPKYGEAVDSKTRQWLVPHHGTEVYYTQSKFNLGVSIEVGSWSNKVPGVILTLAEDSACYHADRQNPLCMIEVSLVDHDGQELLFDHKYIYLVWD